MTHTDSEDDREQQTLLSPDAESLERLASTEERARQSVKLGKTAITSLREQINDLTARIGVHELGITGAQEAYRLGVLVECRALLLTQHSQRLPVGKLFAWAARLATSELNEDPERHQAVLEESQRIADIAEGTPLLVRWRDGSYSAQVTTGPPRLRLTGEALSFELAVEGGMVVGGELGQAARKRDEAWQPAHPFVFGHEAMLAAATQEVNEAIASGQATRELATLITSLTHVDIQQTLHSLGVSPDRINELREVALARAGDASLHPDEAYTSWVVALSLDGTVLDEAATRRLEAAIIEGLVEGYQTLSQPVAEAFVREKVRIILSNQGRDRTPADGEVANVAERLVTTARHRFELQPRKYGGSA